MKTKYAALSALALLCAASVEAESIAPGGTYSQDFDDIGSSTTATLPSGWTVAKANAIESVTPELYQGAGSATEQTGTGSRANGGIYNWVDAGNSADHGVGFLATATQTKTGNLYLALEASGAIPSFTISYDMKCYRNNSRQFQFQLYYSLDNGTTWTSAGSSFCTSTNTTSSAVEVNPAGVTSVSSETLELSDPLSSGDTIVFCWSYSVPSGATSNAQGLGIDNVVIEAGESSLTTLDTPVVTATAEMDGLWLSWTADPHAYDYELQVLDPDGEQAGTWSFNHEQSASQWNGVYVEDLAEETEYTVRLRVLGDGTTYANSSWFEDTFSTIADPWRPEWTIGEPTPSPFVGTAFSFGVSAFRYIHGFDGTDPQTVAFDGLTPVSTGTQPAFANGVFSWTPGMDDDGDYVAAFSVQNDGGTYSTNVAFTVKGTTEDEVLFEETFAACEKTWNTSSASFSNAYSDHQYAWVQNGGSHRGVSGIRIGTQSTKRSITTPTISPVNDVAATVTLSFLAAGYIGTSSMTVSLSGATFEEGGASRTIPLVALLAGAVDQPIPNESDYSFTYSVSAAGSFTITFAVESGDGRMGIDSVKVTQKVSTSLVDLDVPTGLAVVDGTLSTNSFSVAWNAVANASSYGVEVYEAGGTDPIQSCALAATSAAFADLADDTDYEVCVRAQGDTSLYNYSDWTNLVVHTERSALHPTLSVGTSWENTLGDGKLYGVIPNTNTVSATLDDGTTPVAVALVNVAPAPSSAPGLADGMLTWTPATEDEGTTFTLFFEMTPAPGVAYTNVASFKVNALPALQPPAVTVDKSSVTNAGGFASGRAALSWDSQFRATDYAVRAWTGCPNPSATATRVEERFDDFFHGTRPAGWKFKVIGGYDNAADPVKFDDGNWMATYDLGGEISSVSFTAYGHGMAPESTLRVYWAGALTDEEVEDKDNWTNHLVAAVSGLVSHSQTVTAQIPAGSGARRLVWQYTKDGGNVGVGSVVIEGIGFSTPKFLPGWGPVPVSQGLVQSCTVTPTRAGRTNWAEVSVTDGTATYASVVEIDVPVANPATLLILK